MEGRQENKNYRNDAIRAAFDFGYGDEVIKKIKAAKTDNEIERIMRNARKQKWGD